MKVPKAAPWLMFDAISFAFQRNRRGFPDVCAGLLGTDGQVAAGPVRFEDGTAAFIVWAARDER